MSTRLTQGAVATIVFAGGRADMAIEGCNDATADATITSDEIQIDPLVSTDRTCAHAQARAQTAIATVLDGKIRYSIDAAVLQLSHPNGQELRLRAK